MKLSLTLHVLQVAEEHADSFCQRLRYPRSHLRFMVGSIEDLKSAKIEDGSQDILISNCVINLSFNKQKVFDEAYRVLTSGGEFHFSDMYIDRHLDSHVLDHQVNGLNSFCYLQFACLASCANLLKT